MHAAVGMLASTVYTVQELYSTLGGLFFKGADREASAALEGHPWSRAWSLGWGEEVRAEAGGREAAGGGVLEPGRAAMEDSVGGPV